MSRLLPACLILMIAWSSAVRSQTAQPVEARKTKPNLEVQNTAPADQPEDCACESQLLPEVVAIVNGTKITRQDIESATKATVTQLQRQVIEARRRELDLQINSRLLAIEARKRGITTTKLLEQEVVAKVKAPTEAEAQTFFDQNRPRIQGDFSAAREDILHYLRDQREREQALRLAGVLRSTIEARVLIPEGTVPRNEAERARVLAVVNGEPITSGDVEDSLQLIVSNVQDRVYKTRKAELDQSINDTLLVQEAQKRKITTSTLLDAEVKPKTISLEEAQDFYNQNKDRVSGEFAQTKDAIIGYLQQIEVRKAERAFLEKIRSGASIQVFLVAPEPPVFSISTMDQPSQGKVAAPVTIVEFTDYQCPSCAATKPILDRLVKEYGDKLRLVVRDYPLAQHADAFKAAEAAEAAREQGKYWEYTDLLMRNQTALDGDRLKAYASELGLDRVRFDKSLDTGKFAELVQRDIEAGNRLGIDSTPTIFINGRRATDKSYESLKAGIETALNLRQVKTTAGWRGQ